MSGLRKEGIIHHFRNEALIVMKRVNEIRVEACTTELRLIRHRRVLPMVGGLLIDGSPFP